LSDGELCVVFSLSESDMWQLYSYVTSTFGQSAGQSVQVTGQYTMQHKYSPLIFQHMIVVYCIFCGLLKRQLAVLSINEIKTGGTLNFQVLA